MELSELFGQGRIVNAATLGKSKLSLEERRAVNAAKPIRNKYMEAAVKHQDSFVVYDPAFML